MGHRIHLHGLTLGIAERGTQVIGAVAADDIQCIPELGGSAHVGDIPQHSDLAAVSDLPEDLTGKLNVVTLLIDGVGAPTLDINATFGGGDDVVFAQVLFARQQGNIGHALKWHTLPVLAVGAAMAAIDPGVG